MKVRGAAARRAGAGRDRQARTHALAGQVRLRRPGAVRHRRAEQGSPAGPGADHELRRRTVRDAITEVLATQHANTRAKGDKTYHLIVSFRAGEQPSADTLRAIEERICAGLGYGEHQRVSAVHNDTDNLHIHIAINKIHPTRNTMHEPYYSHRALAELCTALERDYGLERDNHEPRQRGARPGRPTWSGTPAWKAWSAGSSANAWMRSRARELGRAAPGHARQRPGIARAW
jgi:hypothetical protein